jgi:hypothetical protein
VCRVQRSRPRLCAPRPRQADAPGPCRPGLRAANRGVQAATGSRSHCRHGMPVCAAARGPVRAAAATPSHQTAPAACWAARPRSSSLSAPQRARPVAVPCRTSMLPGGPHGLVPAICSISASPCTDTADGAVGLARWRFPCLPSHGGFQLHCRRHRRSVTAPPWGCAVLPVCGRRSQALRVQPGHTRAW